MSLLEHKEAKVLLEDAEVSAGTVRGCRRRLTGFLERYLPLFYRKEQREHARLVIEGRLSHLERKTCEPIARQAGVERKPVQQFVGGGKWDDEAVMGEMRLDVAEAFHDPEATLVLDGSGFPKKGTESCGVQRQWCGRLGKVDNCQVGVFLACVSQGRVGPLGRRLYLPRQWAESPARRRKCHAPRSVRFAEKWQLGLKLIEQARQVPHGWVVADDEFGRVKKKKGSDSKYSLSRESPLCRCHAFDAADAYGRGGGECDPSKSSDTISGGSITVHESSGATTIIRRLPTAAKSGCDTANDLPSAKRMLNG